MLQRVASVSKTARRSAASPSRRLPPPQPPPLPGRSPCMPAMHHPAPPLPGHQMCFPDGCSPALACCALRSGRSRVCAACGGFDAPCAAVQGATLHRQRSAVCLAFPPRHTEPTASLAAASRSQPRRCSAWCLCAPRWSGAAGPAAPSNCPCRLCLRRGSPPRCQTRAEHQPATGTVWAAIRACWLAPKSAQQHPQRLQAVQPEQTCLRGLALSLRPPLAPPPPAPPPAFTTSTSRWAASAPSSSRRCELRANTRGLGREGSPLDGWAQGAGRAAGRAAALGESAGSGSASLREVPRLSRSARLNTRARTQLEHTTRGTAAHQLGQEGGRAASAQLCRPARRTDRPAAPPAAQVAAKAVDTAAANKDKVVDGVESVRIWAALAP